jgi:inorganic pyrophosphatase
MLHERKTEPLWQLMSLRFQAHPWHGVNIGHKAPEIVTCYIEIVPTDTVKYELDKDTGLLKIDRPQRLSNVCPTPYGLLPQTYCGEQVAEFCMKQTGRRQIIGDGDPLDICVLTEKSITHGSILLQARPIGGLRMIDGGEADDKIVAVLHGDVAFDWDDISQCPPSLVQRLRHYFLTYKEIPGERARPACEITQVYGREEGHQVIRAAQQDYAVRFSALEDLMTAALRG